jgi:hypothetical protein
LRKPYKDRVFVDRQPYICSITVFKPDNFVSRASDYPSSFCQPW